MNGEDVVGTLEDKVTLWNKFLQKNGSDLIGGLMEIRGTNGDMFCGPIAWIAIDRHHLVVTTKWTAQWMARGSNRNRWLPIGATDFLHAHTNLTEPQKDGKGVVHFKSGFQETLLYPPSHTKTREFKKP